MARERKHPEHCANASRERCECGHCAGTKHGWAGALELVRSQDPRALQNIRDEATRRWREECKKQDLKTGKNQRPTRDHKKAATDLARADLLGWLADQLRLRKSLERPSGSPDECFEPSFPAPLLQEIVRAGPDEQDRSAHTARPDPSRSSNAHQQQGSNADEPSIADAATRTELAIAEATSESERAEALGDLLSVVLRDVEADLGRLDTATRKAMADHFWCDLLAQSVLVIEESNKLLDNVPKQLTKLIASSRKNFTKMQQRVVDSCAKHLWARLQHVLGLGVLKDARALLPALRILAILVCKQPSKHEVVVQHCIDPLRQRLLTATKAFLLRVFGNWVPRIMAEDGGATPIPYLE